MLSRILFGAALVVALASCTNEPAVPRPDLSGTDVDLTVLRFDRALAEVDTSAAGGGAAGAMSRLGGAFGDFTAVYFTHLIPLRRGDLSPAEQRAAFRAYLDYPLRQRVSQLVSQRFPDDRVDELADAVRRGLQHYAYYLPDSPVPDTLVTFESTFELAAFLYGDNNLAVGLDFFLGPDFDYAALNPEETIFSDYLTRTYTPEHLPGKALRALLDDRLPRPRAGRLLDYLVYEGKKLYALRHLLPAAPDHVVFEVSPEEMGWLRENETQIYAYLQREELLYSTDAARIRKYTQPGPSTQGMPPESPGGAVNYLGYRIVSAWMAAHPGADWAADLFPLTDGQQLLTQARYKPR